MPQSGLVESGWEPGIEMWVRTEVGWTGQPGVRTETARGYWDGGLGLGTSRPDTGYRDEDTIRIGLGTAMRKRTEMVARRGAETEMWMG